MVKECSPVTFPFMLHMAPNAFLTKTATLLNCLPALLTRQSREQLRSLHDVAQNIRPTIRFYDTGIETVDGSAAL
jgi:hypothetical protein